MADTEYQNIPAGNEAKLEMINQDGLPLLGDNFRFMVGRILADIIQQMVASGYTDIETIMARGPFKDLLTRLNASDADLRNFNINWINKNLGKLDQTFMTEEFLQQMAGNAPINAVPADGSLTNPKYASESITADKTKFAVSKNLFSGVYSKSYLAGMAPNVTYATGQTVTSAEISLNGGETYTISRSDDTDRFVVGIFAGKPSVGASPTRTINNVATLKRLTITLATNETYLVVYLSSANNVTPSVFQIEKGSEVTEYAPPNAVKIIFEPKSIEGEAISLEDFKIGGNNTKFTELGRNKFSGEFEKGFYLAGPDTNGIYTAEESADIGYQSIIQRVKPSTTYTIFREGGDRFRMAASSKEPKAGAAMTRGIISNDNLTRFTFTTRASEQYLLIYVKTPAGNNVTKFQIEESETFTEYVKPNSVKIMLDPSALDEMKIGSRSNYYIETAISTNYTNSGAFLAPGTHARNTSTVYAFYDNLMSEFPDYISRELVGTASGNLSIYAYHFVPPTSQLLRAEEIIPRILYISGLHGSEERNILDGMRFFKDLCENWKSNAALEMLRWNVGFTVIPAASPWGVDNNQRKNANGVDLNRNFPKDWAFLQSDVESPQYQGANPLSEPESQAISDFLQNNKFVFAIDHHNYNTLASDGHAVWIGTENDEVLKMIMGLNRYLNTKLKKDYSYIDQSNNNLILTNDLRGPTTPNRGMISQYFEQLKIPGVILETVYDIGGSAQEAQNFTTDALGNLILSAVKNLNYINK